MTSENKFHTIQLFNFTTEGEKPTFDLIAHGTINRYLKRGEFNADVKLVPLQVAQVQINLQELAEPLLFYLVGKPKEFLQSSGIVEAYTRGGHHMRLVKEIQGVIDTLEAVEIFK